MPEVLGNFWSIFIFFEKSTEGELLHFGVMSYKL
jgi:hypothetical protein